MSLALTQDTLDIIRLLCDVTLRMIEGEIYQLTKNGVVDLTEDEHFDIVRRKTAYLFARLRADRRHARARPTREQQDALWDYGLNIGMAFQIVDDLLDFTGEEVALGKPVGGDLREGKMTLPVIHLLRAAATRAPSADRPRDRRRAHASRARSGASCARCWRSTRRSTTRTARRRSSSSAPRRRSTRSRRRTPSATRCCPCPTTSSRATADARPRGRPRRPSVTA